MCFYLVGPSSLGIYCTWQKSESCGNISQVRAEEGGNISFTDSQGLDKQEIVSEKKVEQIEIFRQKQIEEEFELEKQKQYQEKLLEE